MDSWGVFVVGMMMPFAVLGGLQIVVCVAMAWSVWREERGDE